MYRVDHAEAAEDYMRLFADIYCKRKTYVYESYAINAYRYTHNHTIIHSHTLAHTRTHSQVYKCTCSRISAPNRRQIKWH